MQKIKFKEQRKVIMSISRKYEFHLPIWDKDLIEIASDKEFWKRFEHEGRIFIKTFQCLVEVKKLSIAKFRKLQPTLDWLGPEEFRSKSIPMKRMIPSDYAASNGGKRNG